MGQLQPVQAFSKFLAQEWDGTRRHSYPVPLIGRSASWSRLLNPKGNWVAHGLKDARLKYYWNGKDFERTTEELVEYSRELRAAIRKGENCNALRVVRKILAWGGVANRHRQRTTFTWLDCNSETLCTKISDAVRILKDHNSSLARFDGKDLIMNSAITKVVSLADDDEQLVIYDSRVAAALAFFAIKFAEETGSCIPLDLRFAVASEKRRNPSTAEFKFARMFGSQRDACHASMMQLASKIIQNAAGVASPREIEAGLFMWGYDVTT